MNTKSLDDDSDASNNHCSTATGEFEYVASNSSSLTSHQNMDEANERHVPTLLENIPVNAEVLGIVMEDTFVEECKEAQHVSSGNSVAVPPNETKNRISTAPHHPLHPGAVSVSGTSERSIQNSSNDEHTRVSIGDHPGEAETLISSEPSTTVSVQTTSCVPTTNPDIVQHANRQESDRLDEHSSSQDDDAVIIHAELVVPPVEALQVCIDEDPPTIATSSHPFELEQAPSSGSATARIWKKTGPTFWVLLALLLVVITCALAIPLTLLLKDDEEVVPTSPSKFPYTCYTSALDILQAQISSERKSTATYIICPNTEIKVGTFKNPATDDYRYVDGDYPIMVVRENVTIQCGIDGRRENNCVVDGGFMHVLTLQIIAMPDGTTHHVNRTNDNLMVRGITFTGTPLNVGPFRGISVSLGHPGRNMRFQDCMWKDMTTQAGLIGAYRNYFQELVDLPLEDLSIEVTFSDCIFQDIVYDSPLIFIRSQTILLERCDFRNIQLSLLLEDYCRFTTDLSGTWMEFYEGCASLLHCSPKSSCTIEDSCIHNFEIDGPGIVVVYENTEFYSKGLYLDSKSPLNVCEMATIFNLDATNQTCTEIFTEPSCPLLP